MSKRTPNHIHRYKKVNLSRDGNDYFVYLCTRATCSHYIPLHLAEGKLCECNRCGEPMVISKIQLTGSGGGPMARPHCNDCIKRRNKKDVEAILEFITGTKT